MGTDYHIIVAAGTGSRYGSTLPKQFCDLAGRPLLMTTIDRFRLLDPAAKIILVISREMAGEWERMCREAEFSTEGVEIAFGGATRFGSVRNALAIIPADADGWVSVHDGARPVVNKGMMERIKSARTEVADGIIPVVPSTDSMRLLHGDGSSEAVDRSRYVRVQTPQSFPARKLLAAYARAEGEGFTDDASVMESAGMGNFTLVEGDPSNIKVTNPGDIALAELFLSRL